MKIFVAKSAEKTDEYKNSEDSKFFGKMKAYFVEYCNYSTIHGIRYLGEKKRTFAEKICWMIAIGLSFGFCTVFILNTYQKWDSAPLIVAFGSKEKPIWQIPFPAVTICPETKTDPEIFNFTRALYKAIRNQTLSNEEATYFGYLSLVCNYRNYDIEYDQIVEDGDDIEDYILYNFFENVTSTFKKHFHYVKFMGQENDFDELFVPIITDGGICYTFNMLNREEMFSDVVKHYKNFHLTNNIQTGWNLEDGYYFHDLDVYPRRALFSGVGSALEIQMLVPVSDIDYTCTEGLQGFKVLVHHPAEVPLVQQSYFHIPPNQIVMAAINPKMLETSVDVKAYHPKKRECYFPSERKLKYFKYYTQENCQIECTTNFTLNYCGCVSYYMPHDNNTLVCGAWSIYCMAEAGEVLYSSLIQAKFTNKKRRKNKTASIEYKDVCKCLSVCTSTYYSVETSQSDWNWESYFAVDDTIGENITQNNYSGSGVRIYFNRDQFISMNRNELIGGTDFVAKFGGLLGLFTGFSLLSLVEVVYFLSLRIWCNIRLYGSQFWAGRNN